MAQLAPVLKHRFLDSNGQPLVGGKLYSYQAGTLTPQATYTDQGAATPNANPVILDSDGECDLWLDQTISYKFILKDSDDVTQWTVDNVIGILTDDAVTTDSLQDGAVTTVKIADDAVTADKLADDASTDSNRAVTTNHIRNDAITLEKMADNALKIGFYNLSIKPATTTNSNDSIKITSSNGSALSSSNPGIAVLPSNTQGELEVFTITSEVTILLTGAHWGLGTKGDLTDQILHFYLLNDSGSVKYGVSYKANRRFFEASDDDSTPTNITFFNKILVNSALSGDCTALQLGYFKANFDDTGGAAEDLWSVQTGADDIMLGENAPLERNLIRLSNGNGHGSTATKIRKYSTEDKLLGDSISYVNDSTLGLSLTINERGVYSFTYSDTYSAGDCSVGLSLNASSLTTNLTSLSSSERLGQASSPANYVTSFSWTGPLKPGDIVRPHDDGVNNLTTRCIISASRVS